MKEIKHHDNKHLDAVNKIRTETEELGFGNEYLGYGDTSVCKRLSTGPVIHSNSLY